MRTLPVISGFADPRHPAAGPLLRVPFRATEMDCQGGVRELDHIGSLAMSVAVGIYRLYLVWNG